MVPPPLPLCLALMDQQPNLIAPGVSEAGEVTGEQVPEWQLQISGADTLQRLSHEYAFHTPALLYLYLALNGRDPVRQYFVEHPEVRHFQLQFDKPIFAGLCSDQGQTAWNHWLFGIERRYWESFASYMGSLAITDRQRKLFARIRPREVRIADALYLDKKAVIPEAFPVVPVTAWCLDTNRGCVWIAGDADGTGDAGVFDDPDPTRGNAYADVAFLRSPPSVRRSKTVLPETVKFADACFAGSSDPYGSNQEIA